MVEIKSFPNNRNEFVGAEHFMRWFHGRTSGVFGAEGNTSVTAVNGEMAVNVSDGLGWISNENNDGIVWWVDSEKETGEKLKLSLDIADAILDRIDRIVVSWETTDYTELPKIEVLKGVPNTQPKPTALTNNALKRQISLAQIKIKAGTINVTPDMITDERLDKSVCGIVTDTVALDTSVMLNQFNALKKKLEGIIDTSEQEVQVWLQNLQDYIDENTEAKLVNDVNNLRIDVNKKVEAKPKQQVFEAMLSAQNLFSNPNLLINGDFQVWQRGESFDVGGAVAYTADRFVCDTDGVGKMKVNKKIYGAEFITDNGTYFNLKAFLEMPKSFLNKTFTLSIKFHSKTNLPKLLIGTETFSHTERIFFKQIKNYTGDLLTTTFVATDVKDLLTVIINLPINATTGIEYIKLEYGSVATPFVPKSYGEELQACQRYYFKDTVIMEYNDTQTLMNNINFKSTMRIIPTVIIKELQAFTYAAESFKNPALTICRRDENRIIWARFSNVTFPQYATYLVNYTADAEIY